VFPLGRRRERWQEGVESAAFRQGRRLRDGSRRPITWSWLEPAHAAERRLLYAGTVGPRDSSAAEDAATPGRRRRLQRPRRATPSDQEGRPWQPGPDRILAFSIQIDLRGDPAPSLHRRCRARAAASSRAATAAATGRPLNGRLRASTSHRVPDREFGHRSPLHAAAPARARSALPAEPLRHLPGCAGRGAAGAGSATDMPKDGRRHRLPDRSCTRATPRTAWSSRWRTTCGARTSPDGKPAVYGDARRGAIVASDRSRPAARAGVVHRAAAADGSGRTDPVGVYFGTTSGEVWGSASEGSEWSCLARPPAADPFRSDASSPLKSGFAAACAPTRSSRRMSWRTARRSRAARRSRTAATRASAFPVIDEQTAPCADTALFVRRAGGVARGRRCATATRCHLPPRLSAAEAESGARAGALRHQRLLRHEATSHPSRVKISRRGQRATCVAHIARGGVHSNQSSQLHGSVDPDGRDRAHEVVSGKRDREPWSRRPVERGR